MDPQQSHNGAESSGGPEPTSLNADEFQAAFGETLDTALDIDTWHPGDDLAAATERLEREIANSVGQDDRVRSEIRARLFPIAFGAPEAAPNAGNYQVEPRRLEQIQRGLLFNGAVEACNGTSLAHDSLALTIAQIGIATVSYVGNSGTWMQRVFRRDLRIKGANPIDEAVQLIGRRAHRSDSADTRDVLSNLSRRGIMAFAERKILLDKCAAPWRMGHGNPTPVELLSGGGLVIDGDMPLLRKSMDIWRALLLGHQRWIFVPSAPLDRVLLTLGSALHPLEYALVGTASRTMRDVLERSNMPRRIRADVRAFIEMVGPQIVIGIYRASRAAPPHMFYAHVEQAHLAAMIAMADSALREHRGFPMLIDLADQVCRTIFGAAEFETQIQQAYVQAGAPFRYLGERQTRG